MTALGIQPEFTEHRLRHGHFRQQFLDKCEEVKATYVQRVLPIRYQEHGILPSEGLAFCAMCDLLEIELVIESGVAWGRSTEIWARYFTCNVIGIDNGRTYGESVFNATADRLQSFPHLTLRMEDSLHFIPFLLSEQYQNVPSALFIDGPKGGSAMALAALSFCCAPGLKFVAIHDMGLESHNHLMNLWPSTVFYTDEVEFRSRFNYLDHSDNPITRND